MQQLKSTQVELSEKEAKEWFLSICKSVIPDFKVDDNNRKILNRFFQYAFRMPEFENEGKSLDKGILLLGPYGTGKTELFNILQRALLQMKSPLHFNIKVMWEIANEFTKEGFEATDLAKGHCFFDEMGLDGREFVQNYGNKVNISDVIILSRYNDFKSKQYISHFTSNKTLKELKAYLDGRSFDRLLEMCNVMGLAGESRRENATPKPVLKIEKVIEPEKPKLNIKEFLINYFKEKRDLKVLPYIELYNMLLSSQFIRPINSDLFIEQSKSFRESLTASYNLRILKSIGVERQSLEKMRDALIDENSVEIKRAVYKKYILNYLEEWTK